VIVKNRPINRRAKVRDHALAVTLAFGAVERTYNELGYEAVYSSGDDGKHGTTSLHWSDNAWDFRVHGMTHDDAKLAVVKIKARLGLDFDVLLEKWGTPDAHIHVEWQPRA